MSAWPQPVRLALTLLAALAAALACVQLHVPLPWMIGPLLLTAALSLRGVPVQASPRLRNVGQGLIGVALGLYFTPQVVALLATLAPAIAAGVAWALLMGHLFYRFLLRQPGTDRTSAFFAAAIGGASEMAVLAERHGGEVDRVAASHSLRVMMVVVLIPFAFQALGVHGADATLPAVVDVKPAGLALLLAAAACGIGLLWRLRVPNPWVLGALLAVALLTANGVHLSALPRWASNAGQLFIGIALGSRFTPAFARTAPRWMAAVALGTLAMIVASALFGWALARLTGLYPATVMLATAPGGIAEMAITAKVLQLGVPVVTAFQALRYVAVIMLTAPMYRWEMARRG